MLLSLVVPCFNEEGNVIRFFGEVKKVFGERKEELEFVFIDDGSKDKTFENLRKLFDENPSENIQVISFSRNFGKEAAMYAGLSHARGDLVCIIDADLQQRPEVVAEMLDILENDSDTDCVAAYQSDRKEGKFISLSKAMFYKIINKMTDVEFVSGASDFRLMRRNMVDAVLSVTEYHRFSKGIFSFVGFNTEYIPYTAAERKSGQSKWGFKKLMKYALEGIMAFSTAPLKLSLWLGVISLVAALVCFITAFFAPDIFSYAAAVVLTLLLGGLILVSSGILGAYLSKIYIEVKKRPVYIIKSHLRREENGKN